MSDIELDPDPFEVVGNARRVTLAEARRHFADGGEILVSEHGHEPSRAVTRSTQTHTNQTITWDRLDELRRVWRSRHPRQRYYIVTRHVSKGAIPTVSVAELPDREGGR